MLGISLILIGALLGAALLAGLRPAIPERALARRRKLRSRAGQGSRDHA